MRKNTINFIVDAVTLIGLLALAATGLIMRFVLPPGTGGRHGHGAAKTLWGLGRHDYGDLHYWISAAIGLLLLIHVALHWAWVCGTVQKLLSRGRTQDGGTGVTGTPPWRRNLYGVGFLVLLVGVLAAFLWIARMSVTVVEEPDGPGRRAGWGRSDITPAAGQGPGSGRRGRAIDGPDRQDDHDERGHNGGITGRMTLAEVASATGVPVSVIRGGLGLPETVSADERLGRLRQQHGFEMSTIRDVVRQYRNQHGQ